jgi:NAD(P)-dependent dehydrogenase (short-subunit alcohol dehydrogenase family)
MLSWILADKYKSKNVTVNACHPGVITTQLLKDLGFGGGGKTQDGAETPLWLATSTEVEGVTNKYFDSKKEKSCGFREERQLNLLWEKLVELTKYKPEI